MRKYWGGILILLLSFNLSAQVSINITGASPHSSAMLDVTSNTRGFLAPRMTLAQRNAIPLPANGLLVYQTDNNPGFYFFNGVSWQGMGGTITETDPVVMAVNGMVKSNGSLISSAIAGVDYSAGTSTLPTGILKNTGGTGAFSIAQASDFPILNQNTTGTAFNVTGVVAIANGGTGSSVQNFVDLSTDQTIAGIKTWGNLALFNAGLTALGASVNINTNSNFVTNINAGTSTGTINIGGTAAQTINIGGGGSGIKTINIGAGTVANTILVGNTASGTKTGINVSATSAQLHIGAGKSISGGAPLKFTAGANLTSPEDGAVEYNGTNYFATSGTTRYTLAKTITTTATLDFQSTNAGRSRDLNITLSGATDGDAVVIGVPNIAVNNNTCYTAWVSAANRVTVRFNNYSGAAVNPTSGTFRVTVIKY